MANPKPPGSSSHCHFASLESSCTTHMALFSTQKVGNLTQKLEQLDSIIKGAKKIQKQVMETIVAENILHDDINRFTDTLDQDKEHRDYIRYKGVIAKEKMRKPREQKGG